jgi:hypothetical protein
MRETGESVWYFPETTELVVSILLAFRPLGRKADRLPKMQGDVKWQCLSEGRPQRKTDLWLKVVLSAARYAAMI